MQKENPESVEEDQTELPELLEPSNGQMANGYLDVSNQFLLVSVVADQIGFTVLPNREICIAGLKLAGQFMPKDPENKLRFLMNMGKWLSSEMKNCLANSGAWFTISRYNLHSKYQFLRLYNYKIW